MLLSKDGSRALSPAANGIVYASYISKEHNAATSDDEGSDFFLCWDRFEVVRPSRLFSFYSSLTTNVSGSLLSAEDIQVWYFLYDVWHLLLFCKHWQISLAQLICLVLVDVKPWKSEIYINKYVPDERAHLLFSEK